ncbi:MAG TPA: hypothetical protein PLC65_16940, partial [Bacteroidia bacterium]|nr:hypothetical protein [Bacteroidia bacterium]
AIDSVPLTFKYSTTQSYESRNGFVDGKKLKNGVLIITKEEVLLYSNKKLNVPDLKSLQNNKDPLIIHQPGRLYYSGINYTNLTKQGDWLYFNFGNYIYKTDGQNLFCFGQEIGIKDSINYFTSIQNPKNGNPSSWSNQLIATNKKLYKLINDQLTAVESADLFNTDVTTITAINDSKNRKFLIRKSFNRINKIYE